MPETSQNGHGTSTYPRVHSPSSSIPPTSPSTPEDSDGQGMLTQSHCSKMHRTTMSENRTREREEMFGEWERLGRICLCGCRYYSKPTNQVYMFASENHVPSLGRLRMDSPSPRISASISLAQPRLHHRHPPYHPPWTCLFCTTGTSQARDSPMTQTTSHDNSAYIAPSHTT